MPDNIGHARLEDVGLTLFLTRRMGLCHWDDVGSIDREVLVYRRLTDYLGQVNFVTYGGRRDRAYKSRLAPIEIRATPSLMPTRVSRTILHRFHQGALRRSDILKTNQIPGSEIAIWFKRHYEKKLITRCGYLFSRFTEEQENDERKIRRAYALERDAFEAADAGVVTSERDRKWVIENHCVDPAKMHVIPNYVVTDLFKPLPTEVKTHDLVCVSKMSPQKNLEALMLAMQELDRRGKPVSLMLIGSASQDEALCRLISELKLDVSFFPRIPNPELPVYLNAARVFVLPSHYEGHPKALLEAMSCGLPCVGTDVVGIHDDLRHRHNGYLCQTDPRSLADAVQDVLDDVDLQASLGENARRYIIDHYSFESVLDQELALLAKLVCG